MVSLAGSHYATGNYCALSRAVFQDRIPVCECRGVGRPIACPGNDGPIYLAAAASGMDAGEIRWRNLVPDDTYRYAFPSRTQLELILHHIIRNKSLAMVDDDDLSAGPVSLRYCYGGSRRLERRRVDTPRSKVHENSAHIRSRVAAARPHPPLHVIERRVWNGWIAGKSCTFEGRCEQAGGYIECQDG